MSVEFTRAFNYIRKDTIIHKLDPRTKMFIALLFIILTFIINNYLLLILLSILLGIFLLFAHIIPQVVRGIWGLRMIFLFIFLVNSVLLSIDSALILIIRITLLTAIFSLIFQTTLPEDLTQSLLRLHIPYSVAFTLSLSFRFVPTMAREVQIIMDAQRSRGHRLEGSGFVNQIRNLFPILIPLLLGSIRRAYYVAEALETRGFGISPPTYYYPIYFKKQDVILIIGVICIFVSGCLLQSALTLNQAPVWMTWKLNV